MIEDGLDYDKTVDTNRLVFKGQKSQKITSYIFLTILDTAGVIVIYKLIESQLSNNPSPIDYLVCLIYLLLMIAITVSGTKALLNRDKLKEIEINGNKEEIKFKLIKAAENLNWRLSKMRENFVILNTKYGMSKDMQTVTIIFFPDNRVFFNSINYPNDYIRRARFDDNYKDLLDEYIRLEKEY